MTTTYYVMTISSVWNRQRNSPITVRGTVDEGEPFVTYDLAYAHAVREWRKTYRSISSDRYVVDFYTAIEKRVP